MHMNGHDHDILTKVLTAGLRTPVPPALTEEEQWHLEGLQLKRVDRPLIFVGTGSCGQIAGAGETLHAVNAYLQLPGIDAAVEETGCKGYCSMEPMLDIQLPGKARLSFGHVTAGDVPEILDAVLNRTVPENLLLGQYPQDGLENWARVPLVKDLRFFRLQQRHLMERCGMINPRKIEQTLATGGYSAFLKTIFTYRPAQVCDIIDAAGLLGRGGSAFPAGQKWKSAFNTAGNDKYLVCNADDADPGGAISRVLLESDPHLVIEGLAIAAYACGASRAFITISERCGQAINRMQEALLQAAGFGLWGNNIFGSGFDLLISLKITPGAFICGEETALISSLEGKRGMPRFRPPYPTQKGFLGNPTVVNNIETLANVPGIMKHGPAWFKSTGTATSPGTKLVSLYGRTMNTGLVEVPMGITYRDIIYSIGEGIRDQKQLKAIHLGGPMGAFTGISGLDTPLELDSSRDMAEGIGSGSMLVLDEDQCLVDVTRHFMDFLRDESCGKCIPCREGIRQMSLILGSITGKPGKEGAHETLERFKGAMQIEGLGAVIRSTSLCGLGRNAPNTVLSAMKLFREEIEEHIFDRHCKAGICIHLRTFIIDTEKCTGCSACAKKCPAAAIIGSPTQAHFIIASKCTGCGICFETCKFGAISML